MGNFPQIGQPAKIPIQLSTPDYLMDHHFRGQPVLPAVEAMETLARTVCEMHPHIPVLHMTDIAFDKFLPMDPGLAQLEAIVELQPSENSQWHARLITRSKAPNAGITRSKVHARLSFSQSKALQAHWPLDIAAVPEGICLSVPAKKIYEELVPFGPAFQNIVSPVYISADGALARIKAPKQDISGTGKKNCLGSPYTLDAALHGACVWAQHFKSIVAFPVAIDDRTIIKPTMPGHIYFGRVRPAMVSDDSLIFDIALLDEHGSLYEMIRGVHMRDVSGGRLRPPDWIIRKDEHDPLDEIKSNCLGLTIVEADAMAPFATQALTPLERESFERKGLKRQKSFLAGRMALKRLYRRCRAQDSLTPARCIETIHENSPLPRCGLSDTRSEVEMICSLSHDRRFAIAVAGSEPAGIDVEEISDKILKSIAIFMNPYERQLVRQSVLEARETALRIWSIKEAAAKSFRMNLADAWQRVQVTLIGEKHSRFTMDGMTITAHHAQIDQHLVSLVVKP
jgi:phosphopantetheinyl transferase (holo-ACP synthase)